jgi:hypothetical protein
VACKKGETYHKVIYSVKHNTHIHIRYIVINT